MQTIAILGSTGSIGTQALELVRLHPEEFRVVALTARSSREKLFEQVREFRPEVAGLTEPIPMSEIPEDVRFCSWVMGEEALRVAAAEVPADMVLVSVVGIAGLQSVMDALGANRQVLLANKEVLVTGGRLVMEAAKECRATLLTVDSEHSAIMQCLRGEKHAEIERILLTASGGPFFEKEITDDITPEEALRHPTWKMGPKITIDSATMMNKGFEVIEARWLFNVPVEKVQVVIHRQSIVHSMVEFRDGSIMANIAPPDMEIPIAYALSYPERMPAPHRLDIFAMKALEFQKPDDEKFPCLRLAIEAVKSGHSAQVVLNAANEVLVARFLAGGLRFTDIPRGVEAMLEQHAACALGGVDEVLALDEEIRRRAEEWIETRQ